MPGRVQYIDATIIIFKLQNGGRNGNAPLLLDFHPVGSGMPRGFAALDRACKMNRTAVEQELFGHCRLSGVGMRDNSEGAPPVYFFFE